MLEWIFTTLLNRVSFTFSGANDCSLVSPVINIDCCSSNVKESWEKDSTIVSVFFTKRLKYLSLTVRNEGERGTMKMLVDRELPWHLLALAQHIHIQMFLCGVLPACWHPFPPRTEMYFRTSLPDTKDALRRRWHASQGYLLMCWPELSLNFWRALRWQSCEFLLRPQILGLHASMQQLHGACRAWCPSSFCPAWIGEAKFCSIYLAWWSALFAFRNVRRERDRRRIRSRRGATTVPGQMRSPMFLAGMKLVGSTSGTLWAHEGYMFCNTLCDQAINAPFTCLSMCETVRVPRRCCKPGDGLEHIA